MTSHADRVCNNVLSLKRKTDCGKKLPIVKLLVRVNLVNSETLKQCISMCVGDPAPLGELLMQYGFITMRDLKNAQAAQSMIACGRLNEHDGIETLREATRDGIWFGEALKEREFALEQLLSNAKQELELLFLVA